MEGFSPGGVVFSPDSSKMGYAFRSQNQWRASVNGVDEEPYSTILEQSWRFSPDSAIFAYFAGGAGHFEGDNFVGEVGLVLNRTPQRHWLYDASSSGLYHEVVFSPDSSRHAYCVTENNASFFVVDGNPQTVRGKLISGWQRTPQWLESQAALRAGSSSELIAFSADSLHYAYALSTPSADRLILDGDTVAGHEKIVTRPILFNPCRNQFCYVTETASGSGQIVWLDGTTVLGRAHRVAPVPMAFSPDGEHLAYVVTEQRKPYLAVDSSRVELRGDPIPGCRLSWSGNESVSLLTGCNRDTVLLESGILLNQS
jgi:hypothetical protein